MTAIRYASDSDCRDVGTEWMSWVACDGVVRGANDDDGRRFGRLQDDGNRSRGHDLVAMSEEGFRRDRDGKPRLSIEDPGTRRKAGGVGNGRREEREWEGEMGADGASWR